MDTGTDVAMNAGHVTLIKGDLRAIAGARAISQQMERRVGYEPEFSVGSLECVAAERS